MAKHILNFQNNCHVVIWEKGITIPPVGNNYIPYETKRKDRWSHELRTSDFHLTKDSIQKGRRDERESKEHSTSPLSPWKTNCKVKPFHVSVLKNF